MIEKILERLEKRKDRWTDLANQSNFDGYAQEEKEYLLLANEDEKLVEIVQEVAKEYGNGWIPVETELPKESGLEHYEITFLSSITKTPVRSVAIFSKGRWYMAGTNGRDCDMFPFDVIAWKEQSAPYQKGE